MDTKPISLWPSCLFIILIIMVNIFMLLILTVTEKISMMLISYFIYLSHQACGRRKPDPSFCHSQHNPIKEVFLMWWVCHLTQRASFTAHWWRTPALLHEGIWNMGCFWLAGSWIYLRRPHAFIYDSPSEIFPNLPLLRDLSNLCCSAVKLPLQFLFPLLAWGKHF